MAEVLQHKVVSALPSPLQANSIYYVRVGAGFDIYVTNSSGTIVAYPNNTKAVFTKEWVSADQVITAGGLLTLSHDLGVAPKSLEGFLVNDVAEVGYDVGDVIPAALVAQDFSYSLGPSIILGSSSVQIRFGTTGGAFLITRKDNNTQHIINATRWKFRLRLLA